MTPIDKNTILGRIELLEHLIAAYRATLAWDDACLEFERLTAEWLAETTPQRTVQLTECARRMAELGDAKDLAWSEYEFIALATQNKNKILN